MFEPTALAGGPSGLGDWPRPFVFRAGHLDGCTIAAGATFFFDLHLFDMRSPAIAYLVLAFAQLGREGLGPGRRRASLTDVWQLNEAGEPGARIFDGQSLLAHEQISPLLLNLDPCPKQVERVLVRFVSPTELKGGQQLIERPEFGILAARIRDRVSTLRALYDDGPLAIDFRGFAERASVVRIVRCEIEPVAIERRSSRTGQVHSIGGFIGEAEYAGALGEFVPYLQAARWTGVGRQTVWGKGEVRAEDLKSPLLAVPTPGSGI